MRTRKLLSGLGAAVMSLMMIIPWAVYADSPQVEDSSIVTESSTAEAMAEQVIKAQKNSTQNTETDWVLFGCIGGGAGCPFFVVGGRCNKQQKRTNTVSPRMSNKRDVEGAVPYK